MVKNHHNFKTKSPIRFTLILKVLLRGRIVQASKCGIPMEAIDN